MLLAVSGGRDSVVLMHAAARRLPERAEVVHIDHGLHRDSGRWADEVVAAAGQLSLPVQRVAVDAAAGPGESPEAAARAARYRVLQDLLPEGGCLLTAHHRRDQVETVLLQLLRGAGPAGLAGMPTDAPFGRGRLIRPFLATDAAELAAYAQAERLSWLEDPSNEDEAIRRNFLRREILPRLSGHWPGAEAAIARSAQLLAETARRDRAMGMEDLGECGETDRVPLARLRPLDEERALNAIRAWLAARGAQAPTRKRLVGFLGDALAARSDRHPRMAWGAHELARFQDALYLLPRLVPTRSRLARPWDGRGTLDLGHGRGRVRLEAGGSGLDPQLLREGGFSVRLRHGGERLRPAGGRYRRELKALLREAGVPPWIRDRLPLLYLEDELMAVGPWWTAAEHSVGDGGLRMRWSLKEGLQVPDL